MQNKHKKQIIKEISVISQNFAQNANFRVSAINEEGKSLWLESELPITAKNPFAPPGPPSEVQLTDWDVNRMEISWKVPLKNSYDFFRGIFEGRVSQKFLLCIAHITKFEISWGEGTTDSPLSGTECKRLREFFQHFCAKCKKNLGFPIFLEYFQAYNRN